MQSQNERVEILMSNVLEKFFKLHVQYNFKIMICEHVIQTYFVEFKSSKSYHKFGIANIAILLFPYK